MPENSWELIGWLLVAVVAVLGIGFACVKVGMGMMNRHEEKG